MNNQDLIDAAGLNPNAHAGTEIMFRRLFNDLPRELLEKFQIFPSRINQPIDTTRFNILWAHDCAGDPIYDPLKNNGWRKFDKFVFVSHWQMNQFQLVYGIPPSRCHVILNSIDPIESVEKPTDKITFFYQCVPRKGLGLLAPVFAKVAEKHPNIELQLYSSFKLYGQEQGDSHFKELFDFCNNHPQIHVNEPLPNDELKKKLAQAHIFAYPSIFPETSCISLMEAMSAKCLCIVPTLGALSETSANWNWLYPYNENTNVHANIFAAYIEAAIASLNEPEIQERIKSAKSYVDVFYNWQIKKNEWLQLLSQMINQGKVADTKEMFVYKT